MAPLTWERHAREPADTSQNTSGCDLGAEGWSKRNRLRIDHLKARGAGTPPTVLELTSMSTNTDDGEKSTDIDPVAIAENHGDDEPVIVVGGAAEHLDVAAAEPVPVTVRDDGAVVLEPRSSDVDDA